MAMDSSRKGASGERKILGIPIVSLAVIAAVFMCVGYYASGYASENTKLIEKYGIARTKILSLSRMVEKMSSNQKICKSNLGQNEQSNKELTLQVSRCKSAKEEEETKSEQCQSQITAFYSAVKEKLNHGENGEVTATVDTKSYLDNTIDGIVKLNAKISKLEEDQSKCSEVEKEFEELKRSTETTNSQIKALATEKEALNDELKNVRILLEEANGKISNFDDHQHKRSFQRKKIPEQDRNVKEEILNEKKEQPKPVNHESGVVDSSDKASSISGYKSESRASSVAHKVTNVTSSEARNTTSTKADNEQTTTNTSTSFTKTNTSTVSPDLSLTTKKALVTEEDDDLEGGFNDTAGEKNSKTTTAPSIQTIKSTLNLNRTLSTSFNNSDNKMTVKTNANVSSSIGGENFGNSTEKKSHSVIDANVRPDILSREIENKENNEKVIEKKGDDNFIDFNERPDITNKEKEEKNSLNVEKITDVDLDELDQA